MVLCSFQARVDIAIAIIVLRPASSEEVVQMIDDVEHHHAEHS